MSKRIGTLIVLILAVSLLAVLAANSVMAFPNMGSDCYASGCHQPGKPLTKDNLQKPAPAAPAPAAPAPATPKAPAQTAPAATSAKTQIIVLNGKSGSVPVVVDKGVTFVEARSLLAVLGVYPGWDQGKKAVTFNLDGKAIAVYTTKTQVDVDGKPVSLPVAAKNIRSRVYFPIEALAKALGLPYGNNPASAPVIETKDDKWTAQWKQSGHFKPNVSASERDDCIYCHNGVAYSKGIKKVADMPSKDPAPQATCESCHVTATELRTNGKVILPGNLTVNAGKGALCMDCHNIRRTPNANDARKSYPHYGMASAMLMGVGAFENPNKIYNNSAHTANPDTCLSCHNIKVDGISNHYFKITEEQAEAACGSCHPGLTTFNRLALGDYDGNGKVEGIQDETKGLLKLLEKEINKRLDHGKGGTFDSASGAFVFKNAQGEVIPAAQVPVEIYKAAWNWKLAKADGSYGVHNPIYTIQILQEAYKELTGQPVPNARIR
ncbi:MAG: ammonia-forming cytochrome c nitrite reductase subunit c552 [Bacillota bacterium]